MANPSKMRTAKREILREELRSRECLRRITDLLESEWQAENVSVNTAKMNGYFRLLNKTLPDAKEMQMTLIVPIGGSLLERAVAISDAMLEGKVTTSQAQNAIAVLESVARISTINDLEARLAVLESKPQGYSTYDD